MKRRRDKRFGLSRETVRELVTPDDKGALKQVVGGGSCEDRNSSHGLTVLCLDNQ
jgi:hypothetical protein